jgi:transcriptional regulator with XRE-family HTH domain
MKLDRLVRAERERLGLTQAQLADAAGICAQSVSNIECGVVTEPSTRTLRALARVFGRSLDELVSTRAA